MILLVRCSGSVSDSPDDDMSHDYQARITARSFKYWSDAAPRPQLAKTNGLNKADLRISLAGISGEQQCLSPFDGPVKVLTYAYFCPDGRIHFDNKEYYTDTGISSSWFRRKKDSRSLIYEAVHKIGHVLGLDHSDVWVSVMWPTAKTGTPALHRNDINGIGSHYG